MNLPDTFNFAEHLFALNRGRAQKAAYVDDRGALGYGQLEDRARRLAAALLASGVRREERVLLLMLDGSDWPVSFLGALYAGVVPVAVNTLLTADDYAYMLAHSGATAALVSGALLPVLQEAHGEGAEPGAHAVRVAADRRPARRRPELRFGHCGQRAAGRHRPPPRRRTRLLALFLRLDRQAQGHGAYPRQPLVDRGALRQAGAGPDRGRRLLLGRQAVLRLWPGQCADLPAVGRRHGAADGRAAHARRHLQALDRPDRLKPTVFFGAPDRLRRHAGLARGCRRARRSRCACAPRPARRCRARSRSASSRISAARSSTASARPRCCTSSSPTGPATCATAPPAGRSRATRSSCAARTASRCAVGEVGDLYIKGPERGADVLGQPARRRAETFRDGWTKSGDKYSRDADGYYTYAGPQRRHAEGERHLRLALRGRGHADAAPGGARGRGDRQGRRRRPDQDQGLRGAARPASRSSEDELKAFVKERLAPYKYPRFIEFVDELPKTATGKIQRFRLRERETGRTVTCRLRIRRHPTGGARTCASNTSGSPPSAAMRPLLVFLHEGLGSIAMWKDFPAAPVRRPAACAAWCSRAPATAARRRATPTRPGTSTSCTARRTRCCRPSSRRIGLQERPWLFGHSDGGSIALLYAARFPERVARAGRAGAAHLGRGRDGRQHRAGAPGLPATPTCAQKLGALPRRRRFGLLGLEPASGCTRPSGNGTSSASSTRIRCPVLAIQGIDDEYGTLRQIRGIAERVPQTRLLELPDCGHSPHRDQPETAIVATVSFQDRRRSLSTPQCTRNASRHEHRLRLHQRRVMPRHAGRCRLAARHARATPSRASSRSA